MADLGTERREGVLPIQGWGNFFKFRIKVSAQGEMTTEINGVPILTDHWPGIEAFFTPEAEILLVESADDVLAALARSDGELRQMAARARQRTLEAHTAARRAGELEAAIAAAHCRPAVRKAEPCGV